MGKKQQALTEQQIPMDSWDDWFENCGRLVPILTEYEDVLWNYYSLFFSEKNDGKKYQGYASHHDSQFYKKEKDFPKCQWKGIALKSLIGLGIGTLIGFIVRLITHRNAPIQQSLLMGLGLGIIVALIVGGVFYCLTVAKVRRLENQLDNLDAKLRNRITYIPPKYRNSIAMKYLYDTFLNYPGVITFHQAIQEIDAWFGQLPRNNQFYIGRVIAVLFDVPYEHTGIEGDAQESTNRDLYQSDTTNPALANEHLPKDIVTKTFKGVDDADEKLQQLIGLSKVKQQVSQMKNRMKFYSSMGGRAEKISGNHMCFLGAPGTGKTTVARIITKILYDFGYIKENKCVELDGNYFKSAYVGETAERTQAIIDYAMGGVLFIDEAYLMMDSKGNTGSAGTEATGKLLKNMEDHQNDFVVIFAGYEDAVNRLLSSNEGFASRVKHKIYFENFTLEELMQIFELDMKTYSKNGVYTLDGQARKLLEKSFEQERTSPTFGNARVVRNALDMILDIHADNFMSHKLSENEKFVLTVTDVQEYVQMRDTQVLEDTRNFIASQNLDNQVISFAELKGRTKEGSKNPDKDLQALTGLQVLKDEVKAMKTEFQFYDGKMGTNEGYHMCFKGAPGTGKSTVASIMTGYLYQMGIIRRNEYLDINGDFLRGMYLGHTGKRTEAVVQYCQGMVLFVDEAYLLQQNDNGDNFGQEAIGVLLDAMEKHRKDFVVIVAGYEKEMNAFLAANTGLKSRISRDFHFQSYTPHELAQMMSRLAKKDGFTVEKSVWIPLQKYVDTLVSDPYFGNGRFIRTFWQDVKQCHIMNFANHPELENKRYVIDLEDMEQAIAGQQRKQ